MCTAGTVSRRVVCVPPDEERAVSSGTPANSKCTLKAIETCRTLHPSALAVAERAKLDQALLIDRVVLLRLLEAPLHPVEFRLGKLVGLLAWARRRARGRVDRTSQIERS